MLRAVSRGFTMIELVTALAVFAVALVPMLSMATRGVSALESDTIRFQAESLCHNTVERFGRAQDSLLVYLKPSPVNPDVLEGGNLWDALPEVYSAMGHDRLEFLVRQYALAMRVELRRNISTGLDALLCEVTYALPKTIGSENQRVAYVRFLLHDHLH